VRRGQDLACGRRRATRESRSRTSSGRWKRSTTTGSEKGIHIPPPRGTKLRGENHHEIAVLAPTGFEPVFHFKRVAASLPTIAILNRRCHVIRAAESGARRGVAARPAPTTTLHPREHLVEFFPQQGSG
jgi:hypothetical protein